MKLDNPQNNQINELSLRIPAISVNESFARSAVSAFCSQLNPTIEELADIKCAVSEAVTNCTVHAYRESGGVIYINVKLYSDRKIKIQIRDRGCGIPDVAAARIPLYTTDPGGERSGMGFTVMENFMDKLRVTSRIGVGTTVILTKQLETGAIKTSI